MNIQNTIYDSFPKNSSIIQIGEMGAGAVAGLGIVYVMQMISSKIARLGALWAGGKMASETCERLSAYNIAINWADDPVTFSKTASRGIACTSSAGANVFFNNLSLPSYETIYSTV